MTPLIVSFVLCAVKLSIVTALPSGMPEATEPLDACGKHYNDLIAATDSWYDKQCEGAKGRAACVVPEHEKAYLELKQRCKQAHDERNAKVAEIYEKLPKYAADVGTRVSLLKESLRNDMPSLVEMVNEQKSLLEDAWKYGAQLQRELMQTSMESDHMQRALMLHSMLVNSSLSDMLQESYRYHGGNSRMVARMLKFARLLPSADERVEVYKQLSELLKSNQQDERYPAILFASDVKELKDRSASDPDQFQSKVLQRWQAQLLAGNFNEVLMFAQDYPEYYAHIEKELYGALKSQWSVEALNRMVHLPNTLPVAAQRVEAFRAVLDALLENQTKQRNDAYLMRLANDLTQLEATLGAEDAESRQALEETKKLFEQFTYARDFSAYAELYKVFRAAF
ncbi:uncharacterized protein LOC128307375 [Anopheles moucheti]|uniref:uncharacterized protein LOC128307375 n=1 Tax=Anopheles moucheti TaxID=186751 RepID=UPI0022F0353C|nr:uncharacterized protein LOC128307375 [Anopheles moucheti]